LLVENRPAIENLTTDIPRLIYVLVPPDRPPTFPDVKLLGLLIGTPPTCHQFLVHFLVGIPVLSSDPNFLTAHLETVADLLPIDKRFIVNVLLSSDCFNKLDFGFQADAVVLRPFLGLTAAVLEMCADFTEKLDLDSKLKRAGADRELREGALRVLFVIEECREAVLLEYIEWVDESSLECTGLIMRLIGRDGSDNNGTSNGKVVIKTYPRSQISSLCLSSLIMITIRTRALMTERRDKMKRKMCHISGN
jgi:hypothetical protein